MSRKKPAPADVNLPLKLRLGLTEMANGERLAAQHGSRIRFCYPQRAWYHWTDTRWAEDTVGQVEAYARETVAAIFSEAAAAEGDTERLEIGRHAVASQQAKAIRAMMELARSQVGIPILPEAFDRDPLLFNHSGGTLELSSGNNRRHAPADLITRQSPVMYDPYTEPTDFLRFLDEIFAGDAELIGYIQRLCGYCLTADVSEQSVYFFYGAGANGKSTLLNVLLRVMGDYAAQVSTDVIMTRKNDAHPEALAQLWGRRLAVVQEIESGRHLAESQVKAISGGDMIRARFMHRDSFQFRPSHKLILATNHRPVIRGTDLAIWRRVHLIPFNVTIPEERRDPRLLEKLLVEEGPILGWMAQGALAWREQGLKPPACVVKATRDYRAEMDLVGAFLAEETEADPKKPYIRVRGGQLYGAYKAWCKGAGEEPVTQSAFGLTLAERGFPAEKVGSYVYRKGLRLLAEGEKTAPEEPESLPDQDTLEKCLDPLTLQ